MSESQTSRMTAVGGVLFVVLLLVAFLLFTRSGFPDSNDRAIKAAAYFTEHRGATLAQQFTIGLSFLAGTVFVAGVVITLWRNPAARPLAAVAAIGGAAAGAMTMVGSAMLTTLAYRPPIGDPGLIRALLDAGYVTFNAAGFFVAAFVGAAAVAAIRWRAFAPWTGQVGLPVAALQLLGAAAYARGDGGLSPQGWIPILALLAFMVWTLCICASVVRMQEVVTPAPAAPAPVA